MNQASMKLPPTATKAPVQSSGNRFVIAAAKRCTHCFIGHRSIWLLYLILGVVSIVFSRIDELFSQVVDNCNVTRIEHNVDTGVGFAKCEDTYQYRFLPPGESSRELTEIFKRKRNPLECLQAVEEALPDFSFGTTRCFQVHSAFSLFYNLFRCAQTQRPLGSTACYALKSPLKESYAYLILVVFGLVMHVACICTWVYQDRKFLSRFFNKTVLDGQDQFSNPSEGFTMYEDNRGV